MPPRRKRLFRVTFTSQGKVYELFARGVSAGEIYGFVEVSDILFGEKSSIVVDPGEDQLKREFSGVSRTMIPFHAIQRIDEVEREGAGTVLLLGGDDRSNIPVLPLPGKR
ncbi:MAG: DUF1820 family protein [Desulfuromonadia bacterium]